MAFFCNGRGLVAFIKQLKSQIAIIINATQDTQAWLIQNEQCFDCRSVD